MISKALFFTLFLIMLQALGIFAVQFKITDVQDLYYNSEYVNLSNLNATIENVNETTSIMHLTREFIQPLPKDYKVVMKVVGYVDLTKIGKKYFEVSTYPCHEDDPNRKYLPQYFFADIEPGKCTPAGLYHYTASNPIELHGAIDEKTFETIQGYVVIVTLLSPEEVIGEKEVYFSRVS